MTMTEARPVTDAATVAVEQVDRDEAARFGRRVGRLTYCDMQSVIDGDWDATDDVQAFARHRVAALATTPLSPDTSRMGASEVERVTDVPRSTWLAGGFTLPDDVDSAMPFLACDAIAALTPVSGHTDGTWDAAIEAAAKVAECWHSNRTGRIGFGPPPQQSIAEAIRNLSPRAASSEGDG